MPDWDAWGDPLLNEDALDDEPINWPARGRFACETCGKVLSTPDGLKSHAINSHGAEAGKAVKRKIHAAERELRAKRAADERAEIERLEARRLRTITMSTEQIDEIINELESLIGMMEPYYSQGDCDKDARALINRLNAMADGREIMTAWSTPPHLNTEEG